MKSLKELRRAKGLSQVELAKLLDVNQSAISQWEKGRTSPDYQKLLRLSEVLDVSVDALVGTVQREERTRIPVLGEIRAGIPVEAIEDVLGFEEIPESMAKQGSHFALRIKGDSMLPRFCPGDIVIVRQQPDADSGDIVAALVSDHESTLKRLVKKEDGIILMPLNPAYDPLVFSRSQIEEMPVRVLGKIVELRARF